MIEYPHSTDYQVHSRRNAKQLFVWGVLWVLTYLVICNAASASGAFARGTTSSKVSDSSAPQASAGLVAVKGVTTIGGGTGAPSVVKVEKFQATNAVESNSASLLSGALALLGVTVLGALGWTLLRRRQ